MKMLFIITALIEVAAGLALAIAPSLSVSLLLGSSLDNPTALVIARVAGAALLSLGVACWLAHKDERSRSRTGLVGAMLLYNISVAFVLAYAGLASDLSGVLLWPAILLHVSLATGCIACLLKTTLPVMLILLFFLTFLGGRRIEASSSSPKRSACKIQITEVLAAQIFRGPPHLAQILTRDPQHARLFQSISHGDHHLTCTYKVLLNRHPYQYEAEFSNTLLKLKTEDCNTDEIKNKVTEEITQFTSQCKQPNAQPVWGEPLKSLPPGKESL